MQHNFEEDMKEIRLTITGFGPFGSLSENLSEKVVEYIASSDFDFPGTIHTHTFPVIYQDADERLRKVIEETKPHILILTGVSPINCIQLEKRAHNRDNSSPDNLGEVRSNQLIIDQAPFRYESNLPLDEFANQITNMGGNLKVSEHAGEFLCNHYYFRAFHMKNTQGKPSEVLFVHMPNQISSKDHKLSVESIASGLVSLAQLISNTL